MKPGFNLNSLIIATCFENIPLEGGRGEPHKKNHSASCKRARQTKI